MQNKSRYRLIAALIVVWPLFTGCYSYISAKGPLLHQGMDQRYFEKMIDDNEKNFRVTYRRAENSELKLINLNPYKETAERSADKDEALKAPLLLRFVWLSDVHMRQREIKLGSDMFTSILDEIVPVAERNKAQEDFYWAVYLSQIEAINALHRESPLDFMIHTGDSVDTGSMEELYQFIYISNKLKIPWLNIVGNHDITIFGNYMVRLGYGYDPFVIFYPVGTLGNFIWMHRGYDKQKISGYGRHLLPLPENCKHQPSLSSRAEKKLGQTSHHGFDLGFEYIRNKCKESNDICSYMLYEDATDFSGIPIPVRLIALNSTKKDKMGAAGSIEADQRVWLERKLLSKSSEINLIFAHHRPKANENDETKNLLANHGDGTIVMFTGHTHEFHLAWHAGMNGRGFYELNTGSVIEFPQIGRVIELRGKPGGRVWLISRALWSSLMTVRMSDMPSPVDIKAVTRGCIEINDAERTAIQKDMAKAVRCGHYGAYDNYLADSDKKLRFWARMQPFGKLWEETNIIIELTPQKRSE